MLCVMSGCGAFTRKHNNSMMVKDRGLMLSPVLGEGMFLRSSHFANL
jgi:hypothetical protein